MNVKDSISATMDAIEGNESGDQSAKNIFSCFSRFKVLFKTFGLFINVFLCITPNLTMFAFSSPGIR